MNGRAGPVHAKAGHDGSFQAVTSLHSGAGPDRVINVLLASRGERLDTAFRTVLCLSACAREPTDFDPDVIADAGHANQPTDYHPGEAREPGRAG